MNNKIKKYFVALSQDDVKKWIEVVKKRNEVVKKIFLHFSDKNFVFDERQMAEIYAGLKNELSEEQVYVYANPKFSWGQMSWIRSGLEDGLSIENVIFYADPKFTCGQMQILQKAIRFKLDINKVMEYINLGFDDEQLRRISIAMLTYPQSDVDLIANINFNVKYMEVIHEYIGRGMRNEEISKYANMKFTHEQLNYVLAVVYQKKFEEKKINLFAKPKFNVKQMEIIVDGLLQGLSYRKVKFYANPKFNDMQMIKIKNAFVYRNLSIAKIKDYAIPEFDAGQMEIIFKGIKENVDVTLYANTCYDAKQMYQIMDALEHGFDSEKLSIILNPELTYDQMAIITAAFIKGATIEQIKPIANSDLTSFEMFLITHELDNKKSENERAELESLLS